jgi:hypothetical protein
VIRKDSETDLPGGIGTLGEKTLHSVLKLYMEPDTSRHEIRVAGFVADIVSGDRIVEIQTRSFNALRDKLARFLAQTEVTIVYPVAQTKWLLWIDEATGELTKRRKSPKIGMPYEVFYELYRIKSLLTHPNLTIAVLLLELEEYRFLNGWSRDKKKGSSRYDRIPIDIAEELFIRGPDGYGKLIPPSLSADFTVKAFKAASGLSLYASGQALNVLYSVGAVVRTGKKGNAYVYARKEGLM